MCDLKCNHISDLKSKPGKQISLICFKKNINRKIMYNKHQSGVWCFFYSQYFNEHISDMQLYEGRGAVPLNAKPAFLLQT